MGRSRTDLHHKSSKAKWIVEEYHASSIAEYLSYTADPHTTHKPPTLPPCSDKAVDEQQPGENADESNAGTEGWAIL